MRSLKMRDGDLVLGPGGFVTVVGTDKVRADLAIAMREQFGSDPFHPRWGSLLPNYVGGRTGPETSALIRGEIARIVQNYMAIQQDQIQRDVLAGLRPRYNTGEVVSEITQIEVEQSFDRYSVRITLQTLSGDQVITTTSVGSDGLAA